MRAAGCPGCDPAYWAARRKLVPTEKQVQSAVRRLYELHGCSVYDLSQPRATMQTEGVPDLYVVDPQARAAWWHEVKRPGGKQSVGQRAFQAQCATVGVTYLLGGVDVARDHLLRLRGRQP